MSANPKIKIHNVDYHRNGVGGEGFFVVEFSAYLVEGKRRRMCGVLFGGAGTCAVLDLQDPRLRWRGDHFEASLRVAVASAEADGSAFDHGLTTQVS